MYLLYMRSNDNPSHSERYMHVLSYNILTVSSNTQLAVTVLTAV